MDPDHQNGGKVPEEKLLVVSSRVRNKTAIFASVLPHVRLVEYNFDNTTLDDLLELVDRALDGTKVATVAFVCHSSERDLYICAPGNIKLSLRSMVNDDRVRNFFQTFVKEFLDLEKWSAKIDFLATYMAEKVAGDNLAKDLEQLLNCQVGLSKNLVINGEGYFDLPTLKHHLDQVGKITKDGQKKLTSYEKIRVVGKGAFGNAVLYRRKVDGLLCIIKEINLPELSANDRQMALNEVNVLAKLDHPNVIGYHDSFEKDGILMIEMEYADGGNLAEFLSRQKIRIEERDILDLFTQMVSAIEYTHSRNVLHRDLKTANIFLTKEGMVKIGDFGISKVLTKSQVGAVTVLGTPYYISPEMCEGKLYDEKSDIWALGCIAYELACLRKAFDASNLPALVKKIMTGQFAPIRGEYSPLFKKLVRDLLQKDPEFRPTASEVLFSKLPEIEAQFEGIDDVWQDIALDDLNEDTLNHKTMQSRPPRSVLYYMKGFDSNLSLTPILLPPRSKVLQVSVSNTHMIALTSDLMVFTWGEGRKGQLGHGEVESWRPKPVCVEMLRSQSITRVSAGDGFSVFTSEKGVVMTCGDGSFGALGHGDWQSISTPKLVESLLDRDISAIDCGSEHIVVVSGQGDIYSWGRGAGGRLGLGHEEDSCEPSALQFDTENEYIINVKCNKDATILLSERGQLYACGNNRYNKLGLDEVTMALLSNHIEKVLVPTKIKAVKSPIVDLSMGPNHTMCLTNSGQLISFGRNYEAQLGLGHTRRVKSPSIVKAIQEKQITLVSCGATFTVVCTNENMIYFWGTHYFNPLTKPGKTDVLNRSFGTRLANPSGNPLSDAEVQVMIQKERLKSGEESGSVMSSNNIIPGDTALASLNTTELLDKEREFTVKEIIADPHEILALYASPTQVEKGEFLLLGDIQCQNQNIFLVIETTCPLAHRSRPASACSTDHDDNEQGVPADDPDFMPYKEDEDDDIPDWLRDDFKDSEENKHARPPSVHKMNHRDQHHKDAQPLKVVDKQKADYQKQLEKEFNKRQNEIRMEAQNLVREREKAMNEELFRLREELRQREQREEEEGREKKTSSFCTIM